MEATGSRQALSQNGKALVAYWLDWLEYDRGFSPNSILSYRGDINQFYKFLEHFPDLTSNSKYEVDLTGLKEIHVTGFFDYLKGLNYLPASVARKNAVVRAFSNYLFREKFTSSDVAANIMVSAPLPRAPKYASDEDIEVLNRYYDKRSSSNPQEKARIIRNNALWLLLTELGVKPTEIGQITLNDIDLASCTLRLSGDRFIPFSDSLQKVFSEYIERARDVLTRGFETDFLFVNHRGDSLTRQGIWLILQENAKAAGVKNKITPRALRHSCAKGLMRKNVPLGDIQTLFGYASVQSVQNIYSSFDPKKSVSVG